MIARFEIEQRTEEWFRIKWGKIGGTRASQIFTKTDTLLIELLSEILEDFDTDYDGYTSDDMMRGIEREPRAREEASKYIGVELFECGWLECEENKLFGISVDGITQDYTISAEIKCPASKKHIATCLADEIPLDNIAQSIHYFAVNPLCEKHYFISYRPEFKLKPLFVKEITRESLVNIGTKAKPILLTVSEVVKNSLKEAELLQKKIDLAIQTLTF